MRYAWLVTSNKTYLPSLNAMLNAMEYYGYEGLDVHIIHDEDIADYLAEIREDYSFKILPVPLAGLTKPGHSLPHNLVYAKYKHAWDIRDDYEAIMHIDCDCLILDNFMKYFEVAGLTDIIPCAQFPHTTVTIDDYGQREAEWIHVNTPLANFPIFYNPKWHASVMKTIWEMQPNEQTTSDPSKNHEMYFFNKALYESGRMERILELPGNLWVTDAFMNHTKLNELIVAGKKTLFNATMDRIQVIHNKFWKEGIVEGELARSSNPELTRDNINKMLGMYDFFTALQTAKET